MEESKTCSRCGEQRPINHFGILIRKSGRYRRNTCNSCHQKTDSGRRCSRETHSRRRKEPRLKANFALSDAKKFDKRRGFVCDLDIEDVRSFLGLPCSYCGDDSAYMGLDRIDNSKGHTRGNVVTACPRCNWVRRDMPIAAWKMLAPAMKEARERGLFKGWRAGPWGSRAIRES